MSTGISFPSTLPIADRAGYGDTFEEIRSAFEPEVGAVRRRNRMRTAPRLFNLQWILTQDEFHIFDLWWQDSIKGGERDFDIQVLDDDETLVWYTVRAFGEYKADIVDELQWQVSLRVRALSENFGTYRAPGTDELVGQTSIGVAKATGAIRVYTPMRGTMSVGLSAIGEFNVLPMRGQTTVGMYWLPRGTFAPIPLIGVSNVGLTATGELEIGTITSYSELSRQWQNLDWLNVLHSTDIVASAAATSREWMGI